MKITYVGLPVAVLSVSLFGACQNTARGIEQDTERNTAKAAEESREARAEADRAADATKNTMERAADATQNAAERAVDATKDASREVVAESREAGNAIASATDAAQQTLQIKTALIDADNLDAAGINVDTDGPTKTVTLKGHVPTAAQKAAAERIAKAKAPSYKVVNQIAVR